MSSTPRQITVDRTDDDRWVAADEESGLTSEGESMAAALVGLGLKLGAGEREAASDVIRDVLEAAVDAETREMDLDDLAERLHRRFTEADVTDRDVDDAIRWARSR